MTEKDTTTQFHSGHAGVQTNSSTQLKPLTQLAARQPHTLSDIIADPAIWLAYTPLTVLLLILLWALNTAFWRSLFASAVTTSICVLYAAQQRLLLGRQQSLAVRQAHKAVTAAGEGDSQRQRIGADQESSQLGDTQIMLTLLGAEITDSLSAEGGRATAAQCNIYG